MIPVLGVTALEMEHAILPRSVVIGEVVIQAVVQRVTEFAVHVSVIFIRVKSRNDLLLGRVA